MSCTATGCRERVILPATRCAAHQAERDRRFQENEDRHDRGIDALRGRRLPAGNAERAAEVQEHFDALVSVWQRQDGIGFSIDALPFKQQELFWLRHRNMVSQCTGDAGWLCDYVTERSHHYWGDDRGARLRADMKELAADVRAARDADEIKKYGRTMPRIAWRPPPKA